MPSKASSLTVNSAAAARASAHPYAAAQTTSRASRRTSSVEEKSEVAPLASDSPGENVSAQTSKGKKKGSSGAQAPKSTRQQFTACHACRYRRVKCDLKDLSAGAESKVEIGCTNCRERGIRCKDDYADSKKPYRRGKRINQLELEDSILDNADDLPAYHSPLKPRSSIPTLRPEFFDSPFFRRFYVQRPIIDPLEFRSRYVAWLQHQLSPDSNAALSSATAPLSVEGQLLAKILVVWAAAYGVDESGVEHPENSYQDVQKRRLRVKHMIEEVIRMIDSLGLPRKPSWDGVRCLLMTLPLTEDVLDNPMDRLAMYEAAVQQVYTLCQHDGVATGLSTEARAANALVRIRIFWYAHVHEGLTTGLRGGRLLMDDDDLEQFNKELPSVSAFMGSRRAMQPSNVTYSLAFQYATAPIRLASACRKVHAALTGPKARAAKRLDGTKLEETWEALARCWEEFEGLRSIQRRDYINNEDTVRFVDGWQIFLFECYNVIQEKIRDRLDNARAAQITELDENPDSPATVEALVHDLNKYLAIAEAKCFDVLDHVIEIIRRHLGSSFFAYDASLVRDGCFFAGHTLALMPGRDEDVKVCLQALSEMRWAFSKGHERSQTIRLAWKSRTELQKHKEQSPPHKSRTPSGGNVSSTTSPDMNRSHATSIISSPFPQRQHPYVSSLPSHSGPLSDSQLLAGQSIQQPSAHPQRRHPGAFSNGATQMQTPMSDIHATTAAAFPDRSISKNWSPVHTHHPSTSTFATAVPGSNQSSSSDGSSPPELGPQPIAYYQLGTKSPIDYDAMPPQHMHGEGSPNSSTRGQPPRTHPATPHAPQGWQMRNHILPQPPQQPPQPYMPLQNRHPHPTHHSYQVPMTSNDSGMHSQGHPAHSHSHGPLHTTYYHGPYITNPQSLTPDEMAHYPTGGDYFPSYIADYSATRGSHTSQDPNQYISYPNDGTYYTQQ